MINTVFFVIITILLSIFDISNIAIRGNEVKNYILSFPVSLVKRNVVTNMNGSSGMTYYIDSLNFQKDSDEYFNKLPINVRDIKFNYSYFNYDEHGQVTLITNNEPKNVQIHVICKYYKDYEVNEYLTFKAEAI